MLEDSLSVRDISCGANGKNATSKYFDVIKTSASESGKNDLRNEGSIKVNHNKTDFLARNNATEIDNADLSKNQEVCDNFVKQENGASFRPRMSQAISNFWDQLREVNPKFERTTEYMQEVSLDTDSFAGDMNIYTKWESKFRKWSKIPSEEEEKKFVEAGRAIRQAIYKDAILSRQDVRVVPEGSYRAKTHSASSDLDVIVCRFWEPLSCTAVRHNLDFSGKDNSLKMQETNLSGDHRELYGEFMKFRMDIEKFLIREIGENNYYRDNRVFKIKSNIYGKIVEIITTFICKDYAGEYEKDVNGYMKYFCDNGRNFAFVPDLEYINGNIKHKKTGKRYKKTVRILKKLRDEMQNFNIQSARGISSYFIESIVYNVPNVAFGHRRLTDDIKDIINYSINCMNDGSCEKWKKIDEHDFMFNGPLSWLREQAHEFLLAVRGHIGFESLSGNNANAERLSEIRPQLEEQVEKLKDHIKKFNKYSRENKTDLYNVLNAVGANKYSFKALLEMTSPYCRQIQRYLRAGEQDLDKLESHYQSLQCLNHRLDMFHERLLEKLTSVGSSTEEVENRSSIEKGEDLGTDLQALFGMDQESVGDIDQNMEEENDELSHEEEEIHPMNANIHEKELHRAISIKNENCAKELLVEKVERPLNEWYDMSILPIVKECM
jgi:hypothetical protein